MEKKKKKEENVSTWSMLVLHQKEENDEVHMYMYKYICKVVIERKD
jgi:hypothetical protein